MNEKNKLIEVDPLSDEERARYTSLEGSLWKIEGSYVERGDAYLEIRESRLYREEFDRWEDYCASRWEKTHKAINQWIRAALVAQELISDGLEAPATRQQALQVYRLDRAERVELDGRIKEMGGYRSVSAKCVGEVADVIAPPEPKPGSVPMERPNMALVTKDGRVGPSTRAKATVMKGLLDMSDQAKAIQELGPYAVEDILGSLTEEEAHDVRTMMLEVYRLQVRVSRAFKSTGFDAEPELGQQQLLDEDEGLPMAA